MTCSCMQRVSRDSSTRMQSSLIPGRGRVGLTRPLGSQLWSASHPISPPFQGLDSLGHLGQVSPQGGQQEGWVWSCWRAALGPDSWGECGKGQMAAEGWPAPTLPTPASSLFLFGPASYFPIPSVVRKGSNMSSALLKLRPGLREAPDRWGGAGPVVPGSDPGTPQAGPDPYHAYQEGRLARVRDPSYRGAG